MPQQNYYQVLGVSQNATTEAIKKAYHELANKIHPDRAGQMQTSNGISMDGVTEAYKVLKDPEQRRAYDASLSKQGTLREMLIVPIDTPTMGSAATGALVPVREFDLMETLDISKADHKQLTQMAKENLQVANYLFKHKEKYFPKIFEFFGNRLRFFEIIEIARHHIELAPQLISSPEYHAFFTGAFEEDLLAFALHSRELCRQILAQATLVEHFSYSSLTVLAQFYGAEFMQATVGQYLAPLDLKNPALTPTDIKKVLKAPRYKAEELSAKLVELGQKNETFAKQCLEDDELRNFLSNDKLGYFTGDIVSIAAAHEATARNLLKLLHNKPSLMITSLDLEKLARTSSEVFQEIVKDVKLVNNFDVSTLFKLAARYNIELQTVLSSQSSVHPKIEAYKLLTRLINNVQLVNNIKDSELENLTLLPQRELVKAGQKSQAIAKRFIENATLRQYLSDNGQVSLNLIWIATKYEIVTLSLLGSKELWRVSPTYYLFSLCLDYFTNISAQVFLKILEMEGFARALTGQQLQQAIQKYGAEIAQAILTNTKLTPPGPSLQQKLTAQLLLNRGLKRPDAVINQQVQTAAELQRRQQQEAEELYQLGLSYKDKVDVARLYFQKAAEKEHLQALDKLLELASDNVELYLNTLQQAQTAFEAETLRPRYQKIASWFNEKLITTLIARIKRRSTTFSNKVSLESDPEFGLLKGYLENKRHRAAVIRAFIHCYKAVSSFSDVLSYYKMLVDCGLNQNEQYEKLLIELYLPELEQGIALADCADKPIPIAELARPRLYEIITALAKLRSDRSSKLRGKITSDLIAYLMLNEPQPPIFSTEMSSVIEMAADGAADYELALNIATALIDYHIQHSTQLGIEPLLQTYEKVQMVLPLDYCEKVRHAAYQAIVKLAQASDNPFAVQTYYEQLLAIEKRLNGSHLDFANLKQRYIKALQDIFMEKVQSFIATLATYEDKHSYIKSLPLCSLVQLTSAGVDLTAKLTEIRKQTARAELDARCADVSSWGVIGLGQFYQQVKAEVPSEYRDTVFHAASRYIVSLARESSELSNFQTFYDSYFVYIKETFSTESQIAYYLTQLQQYFLNKVEAYVLSSASRTDKLRLLEELLPYKLVKAKTSYIDLAAKLKALQSQVEQQQVDERLLALDPRFNSLDPKVLYEACLAQVSKPNLRVELLSVYEVLDKLATSTEQSLREKIQGLRQQVATVFLADTVSNERELVRMVKLYGQFHTALAQEDKERLGKAAIERILVRAETCEEPTQIATYYHYCKAFKQAIAAGGWDAYLAKLQRHFLAKVEAHLQTLTDKGAQRSFLNKMIKLDIVKENPKQGLGLRGRFAVTSSRYHFYGRNPYQGAARVNEHLVSDIPANRL